MLDNKYLESHGNANGFERLMKEVIIEEFNNKVKLLLPNNIVVLKPRFGHHFPDLDLHIDDKIYGIELKSRNNGSWNTLGGSVIESISKDNYEEIYLLFASFNKKIGERSYKVRYKPYWQAADAIKVTHSPRFDLNLNTEQSVFSSNEDYKKLRSMPTDEKLQFIRKTLAENANGATWYTNPETVPPTMYSGLNKKQKDKLKVEVLTLFPQDLLHQPRALYSRITDYLLSQYFIVNTSTRDMFSAGGTIEVQGQKFPKIIDTYKKYQDQIIKLLDTNDFNFTELAQNLWGISENSNSLQHNFLKVIDDCGSKYFMSNLDKVSVATLSELIFSR